MKSVDGLKRPEVGERERQEIAKLLTFSRNSVLEPPRMAPSAEDPIREAPKKMLKRDGFYTSILESADEI